MDDSEFDIDLLDQLLNFLSPPPSPTPTPTPTPTNTLQKQVSSIAFQTLNTNADQPKNKPITNHHPVIKKNKPIITDDNDQVQDPPKEKEITVEKKKKKKKVIRRDVERQRRRDMTKLYQRLRLLIPAKYLRGKRSISDHLEEIVEYIKDLRKKIEELKKKRVSLKEMRNINCSSESAPCSSSMKLSDDDMNNGNDDDRIRVKSCNEGVEISVEGGFCLSKVIKVLMKEGLIVTSCISSTVNQRLLHIIQSKVNTREDIDLARLRFKLMSLS